MTRKERVDDILQILRDKNGEAKSRYVFSLMFQRYSLTKKTFWSYLEDLKTAGKIDYPGICMIGQEDEMIVKLCGEKKG